MDTSRIVALLGVLEAAIHVAGTANELQRKLSSVAAQAAQHHGTGVDNVPVPSLNWSHVTGFLPLIGLCLQRWINEYLTCNEQLLKV